MRQIRERSSGERERREGRWRYSLVTNSIDLGLCWVWAGKKLCILMSRSKYFVNLLNSLQPLPSSPSPSSLSPLSSSSSPFSCSFSSSSGANPSLLNESVGSYFGRIDRVMINSDGNKILPTMLTTRPTKRVPFDVPVSFVMGPTELNNVFQCRSLEEIMSNVISLDSSVIQMRLELIQQKKLDLVLLIFSSEHIPCQPATLNGITILLSSLQQEATAQRYQKVIPQLEKLIGPEHFQTRIELFAKEWNDWKLIRDHMWGISPPSASSTPSCDLCFTFEQYCEEFDLIERQILEEKKRSTDPPINEQKILSLEKDLLILTRKLLFVLLSCNQYFGMDGFTYDRYGQRVGEEFIAINSPIVVDESSENPISCIFLSEVDRFNISFQTPTETREER
jgi:hypothetical protein